MKNISNNSQKHLEKKENTIEIPHLHQEIKDACFDLYKLSKYRTCVKKAFSIVRSGYRNKFSGERIPEKFSEIYYVSGSLCQKGSQGDKDFQNACKSILRSVNNFRNNIEHSNEDIDIPENVAIHYLYLCSMALDILDKTQKYTNRLHPFARSDYKNEKMKGTIKFDYSNNDGMYQIGKDSYCFTIKVSSCRDNSLHLYKDPVDIEGVGLVKGLNKVLSNIDKNQLVGVDMSSKTRIIDLSHIGVLLNKNGMYALLRLKKATRCAPFSAEIEYFILRT